MKKIMRKTLLYKTKVEYGDYTMNHILGCSHGCKYPCYAFMLAKRFGKVKSYEEWIQPNLVDNTLELLDKEIPKLKGKIQSVQLCFTTDPFMYKQDDIINMSIEAIKKLNSYDIKCRILTKGILPAELLSLSYINEYGISLVSLDEEYRKKIEPYSATLKDRINALKYLSEQNLYTWVSMEPYPTPNIIDQDIYKILSELSFVNKIIFGRTNYNKLVNSYKNHKQFYNNEACKVIDFCKNNKIEYYIKQGTMTK